MEYLKDFAVFLTCAVSCLTILTYFTSKLSNAVDAKITSAMKEGRHLISESSNKAEQNQKYNTQKFKAIERELETHSDDIKTLQRVQVAKATVEEMLDSRVIPIERDIEKLRDIMEKGFKRVEEAQTLGEMNIQNVLVAIARLDGKIEGSGVLDKRKSHD